MKVALPFSRATFFDAPCGARRRGAGIGRYFRRSGVSGVFSEFRTTGSVFGVQGYQGREMCCGAPKTSRSEEGFEARGTREEKCAVMPRKLRRVGHQQENYMQIPKKAVK